MDTVSGVPGTSAIAAPPVVNNINLSTGNSDAGSNWWHAYGESGGQSFGKPPFKALPDDESGGNSWSKSTRDSIPDGDSRHPSSHRKPIEDQWKPDSKPWKPDTGQWEIGTRPTKDEYWAMDKDGVHPEGHKGKHGKPVSQFSFVMQCRAYLAQKCTQGSRFKNSHSRITSLSDADYDCFIRMACPSAEERDVKFCWSLSKSERLDVVNEGEMSNVDSIEACCI